MESDTYDRFRLAAMIAEMEGMIAENQCRLHAGQAPAYSEDSFRAMADIIRIYSTKVNI